MVAPPDLEMRLPLEDKTRSGQPRPEISRGYVPPLARSLAYQALESLANRQLALFALALELPEHHFEPTCGDHCSVLFANSYPPITSEPAPGQLRLGPHTDYGSLTILFRNETPGGLEVFHNQCWEKVPDVAGTFVVNIGDLMARWTNDRSVSTLHRVVNPGRVHRNRRRLSIPFLHPPAPDAVIECLPTCQRPGRPRYYDAITSGDNYRNKTAKTLQS